MKNKGRMIAGFIVVVLICVVIGFFIHDEDGSKATENSTNTVLSTENEDKRTSNEISSTENIDVNNTETEQKSTRKPIKSTDSSSEQTVKNTEEITKNEDGKTLESSEKDINTIESKELTNNLPYTIPNSEVTIEYINGYSGRYLEDGSDEKIDNVIALKIKNDSDKVVEYGIIELRQGKKSLQFDFSSIPSGEEVIVLEASKTKYSKKSISYVTSSFAYLDEMSMEKDTVKVEQADKNGLTIENLTDNNIKTVRIFYKYQLETGEFIGGITYTAKLEDLQAGESRTIYPAHYANDGSIVMMVRTYDE